MMALIAANTLFRMFKNATFSPAHPMRAKTPHVPTKAAASEEARRYIPSFA